MTGKLEEQKEKGQGQSGAKIYPVKYLALNFSVKSNSPIRIGRLNGRNVWDPGEED